MRKSAILGLALAALCLCAADASAARVNRVNVRVNVVNRPAVAAVRVNVVQPVAAVRVNVANVAIGHGYGHAAAVRSFGYGYAAPLQLATPVYSSCYGAVQSIRQEVVTTKEEIVEVPQPAIQQRTVTTIRRSIVSP